MIEYASVSHGSVSSKIASAPSWVRRLLSPSTRSTTSSPGKPAAAFIVGTVAPGLSRPAYSPTDRETLPEVITRGAWDGVLEQVANTVRPVGLWEGHGGRLIASTSHGTLTLTRDQELGIVFEAKIEDYPVNRLTLQEIPTGGAAVSIGYGARKLSHRDVNGQRVRFVEDMVVDHIALVLPKGNERALYGSALAIVAKTASDVPAARTLVREKTLERMGRRPTGSTTRDSAAVARMLRELAKR